MTDAQDMRQALVRYACDRRPLGPSELAKARVVLADAVVQALAVGARERRGEDSDAVRACRAVLRFAASAPVGAASTLAGGRPLAAEDAALVNATLIHALLTDDAHPAVMLHPAAVVIPAALAVGEECGVEGSALLRAIAAGYRTMAEVAAPAAERTAAAGLRNTALFGPVAAAVAAAYLFDLDERRASAAIMFALGSSGGTLQSLRAGTAEWRMQPGFAARLGVCAARLARALDDSGLEGSGQDVMEGVIEGDVGFYASIVTGGAQNSITTSDIDGLLGVTHKEHATCGANQLAVETFAALRQRRCWGPEDIARIDIELEPAGYAYPGCNSTGPFDAGGGFLSRPLAIAAILLTGHRVLTEESLAVALADPRVAEIMSRVHSRPRSGGLSRHPQQAAIFVTTVDGTVHEDQGGGALEAFTYPDMARRIDRLPDPERARAAAVWEALQQPALCAPAVLLRLASSGVSVTGGATRSP